MQVCCNTAVGAECFRPLYYSYACKQRIVFTWHPQYSEQVLPIREQLIGPAVLYMGFASRYVPSP